MFYMPRGVRNSPQSRNWCFRLSNPTDEETEHLSYRDPPNQEAAHPLDDYNIKFLVYQLERGPTTGTPHYQGYVMFVSAISRNECKRRLGTPRVNVRVARGKPHANILYCTKDATRISDPVEFGERPAQGRRNDLQRLDPLREMLKAGRSMMDIAEENFHAYLRYGRGLQAYKAMVESMPRETPRSRTRLVLVLGHPGMGKNTWVRNSYPKAYWPVINSKWYDGYIPNVHDTIVMDEFVGQVPLTTLNTLCGVDPTRVETKGGSHGFFGEHLVIMSNLNPIGWWRNTRVSMKTFFRRIDTVVIFKEKYIPTMTTNVQYHEDGTEDRSEPCEEIMRALYAGF